MIKYDWDEETGVTKCVYTYGNRTYVGEAKCHPEDDKNEKLGMRLAYYRALLKLAKDNYNMTRAQYQVVKDLQNIYNNKKEKNFILNKRVYALSDELEDWNFLKDDCKRNINDLVHSKETYERLRTKAIKN